MKAKKIAVTNWDGKAIELSKPEYVKKFSDRLDFLDILVNYDDSSEEERDGVCYYIESKSEEMSSTILESVRVMASDEFDRLYCLQKKVA